MQKVTEEQLISIAKTCPHVALFEGERMEITEGGIQQLAKLWPQLKQLWMGDSPLITDKEIISIGTQFTNLKELSFNQHQTFTQSSLTALLDQAANLENLCIYQTSFKSKELSSKQFPRIIKANFIVCMVHIELTPKKKDEAKSRD